MIYMSVLNSHLFLPCFSEKSPLFSPNLQYYFTQSPVLLRRCCNMYEKSHAHLQCVYNNYARFDECQLKGVGGDDYTK
jgi:hypothetical protein